MSSFIKRFLRWINEDAVEYEGISYALKVSSVAEQKHLQCSNISFNLRTNLFNHPISSETYEDFPDEVPSDTPILGLAASSKVAVFYVDSQNILRRWAVTADGWEKVEMGEAKLPIGEYRKLTGCWTSEEQIALFFENSTGQLQRLSVDAKGWKILNQAAARREEASPFVAMACSFQTVTLFYCHEDKHLHRLTIDLKNDTCNDNIQQGTRFRAIPADIMVVQADNDDIWTYILKGDDEPPGMYEIGPHGERAVIGETFERNPVPSTLFSGKTKMIRIQGGQRN